MKRLKVVLLSVAVGVAMIAAVSSPGMTQIGVAQPSGVTPTYQDIPYANASDTQNIPADAAAVDFLTARGQSAMDCAALAARGFSTLPDARVNITSASDVAA